MPVGKSIRFEVFARDGFICQYCGKRPPETVLELDHIHPVSKGGTDDIINLITACFDCNRGKRAKVLGNISPRPDADLALLAIQQEIVEAKRFMKAQREKLKIHKQLIATVEEIWIAYLVEDRRPNDKIILGWLNQYGADEIKESIIAASRPYSKGNFGTYDPVKKLVPYISAILRNRRERKSAGVPL